MKTEKYNRSLHLNTLYLINKLIWHKYLGTERGCNHVDVRKIVASSPLLITPLIKVENV